MDLEKKLIMITEEYETEKKLIVENYLKIQNKKDEEIKELNKRISELYENEKIIRQELESILYSRTYKISKMLSKIIRKK